MRFNYYKIKICNIEFESKYKLTYTQIDLNKIKNSILVLQVNLLIVTWLIVKISQTSN